MQIWNKRFQSRSPGPALSHILKTNYPMGAVYKSLNRECQKILLHSFQNLKPKHVRAPSSYLKILKGKWTVNNYGESVSNSSTWWDHLLINVRTVFCIQLWIKILKLSLCLKNPKTPVIVITIIYQWQSQNLHKLLCFLKDVDLGGLCLILRRSLGWLQTLRLMGSAVNHSQRKEVPGVGVGGWQMF